MFILHRKLKRLNLGGNELTSVPQKSLGILDTLKKLEIQENKIRVIKDGDFEGKTNKHSILTVNCISPILHLFNIHFQYRFKESGLADIGAQSTDESTGECVPTLEFAELARIGG